MTNYYATLGVPPNAGTDEIKSAYRRLVHAAHPDRNSTGAERFRSVQAAYEVLGHPERRAAYERERAAWLRALGAIGCPRCGTANRVPPFGAEQRVACGTCKADLGIVPEDRRNARQVALVSQALGLVDAVGVEMLGFAQDAVRLGMDRLRAHFGITQDARRTSLRKDK